MSTEFYNTQWQMPNEANKSKLANHSLQAGITTSGEKVEVTNLPFSDSKSWTISFWAKPTTISAPSLTFGGSYEYSNPGGFIFYLNPGGSITFYSNPNRTYFSFATGNNVVSVDTWHHIIFTYNYGVDYRIYVNGVLQAVSTGNGGSDLSYQWPTQDFGLFESASPSYAGYRLRGALSDWCFFNYALSDTATSVGDTATGQIAQLYGNGSSLSNPMDLSPAPKVYYKLSDSVWDGSEYITPNNAAQDYVFDNIISSRIFTPINVSNLTNVTQSVWFKTSTNAQSNKQIFFVGQYGTFVLQLFGTDTLRAGVTVNPLTQTYPSLTFNYADGKWHQYIMNYDGSHVKLYIDGVLRIKTARTGTLRDEPTYFTTIGNVQGTSANAGAIGEYSNFVAYEHTLTDGGISIGDTATGEIATLYNYGSPIRTLANIPQSSNLKAWYKLDASEIYNSSSGEWEINNAASPWTTALKLDGTSDYIDTNNAVTFTSFSVSVWFKASSSGTTEYIASTRTGTGGSSKGFSIYLAGNLLYMRAYKPGSHAQTYVGFTDTTSWHNAVLTYDGSAIRGYLDGSAMVDSPDYGVYEASTANMDIGARTGFSSASKFEGLISNASLWDDGLTLAQVLEIYNGGNPSSNLLSHSASSNLVSWWKLDNTTSGVEDSKGSRDGTVVGTPTKEQSTVTTLNGDSSGMSQSNLVQSDLQTVEPYSKYAMNFNNGNGNFISFSNIALTGSKTVSLWFNPLNATDGVLVGGSAYGIDYYPYFNSSAIFLRDNVSSTNLSYSTGFSANTWYHICVAGNGTTATLYVNGALEATGTDRTPSVSAIGRYTDSNAGNYNGLISNVAIWNIALTAAEARELYNEGLPSDLHNFSGTAPVAWWKLGEGVSYDSTSLIVQDYKGSNHGTSSSSMDQTNIVNGVGTSLNGSSAGFSAPSATVTNVATNAPYSDKNAVSVNMQSAKSNSGISNSTPQAT